MKIFTKQIVARSCKCSDSLTDKLSNSSLVEREFDSRQGHVSCLSWFIEGWRWLETIAKEANFYLTIEYIKP
jgi:hypothetical protein